MKYWVKTSGLFSIFGIWIGILLTTTFFGDIDLNLPTAYRGLKFVPTPLYMLLASVPPALHGYFRSKLQFPAAKNTRRVVRYFDSLVAFLLLGATWLFIQIPGLGTDTSRSLFLSFVFLTTVTEFAMLIKLTNAAFVGPAIFGGSQLISLDIRNWIFQFPKPNFDNVYLVTIILLILVVTLNAAITASKSSTRA